MASVAGYSTIISAFFTELQTLLHNYVYDGYNALASALQYPLGLAITLYITLLGIAISQGWVQMSAANLIKSALKIAVIYTCAMNWSFFSEYFVSFIQKGASEIGAIMIDASPVPIPNFGEGGINAALQLALIEFTKVGAWIYNEGSWHNWSPYLTGMLYWVFGIGTVVLAVFELAQALIMLSILLTLAPLFISFALFKPTYGLFDRWLGACTGFTLQIIFVSAAVALVISLSQWFIADTYAQKAVNIHLMDIGPVVLVGIVCWGVVFLAAQQARAIGGAVNSSSAAALMAGTVGGAIGSAMTSLRLGREATGFATGVKKLVGAPRRGGDKMGEFLMNKMRGGKS